LMPITILCILFSATVSSMPSIFLQRIISAIEVYTESGDWDSAKNEVIPLILILVSLYVLSAIAVLTYTQLMAYITQGFLSKMRRKMFDRMQDLPISYFDTHKHGDIMSYYTNDIDTLRQLVSQSLPQLVNSCAIIIVIIGIMIYY
ncbi:MAG: ABC transporter ATP-binding protein, partial [Firmicutes bacterium]|nr:ABC transporter ATP-binding protein [Bacillota bacterium]